MQKWQEYVPGIKETLIRENVSISTGWDDEIEQFLALMKLLPARSGARAKSHVVSFTRVIEKFIIHSEVNSQM